MIVFPNCKINLGLRILRKRPDGFHDLETVFYPVALQDALEVIVADQPDREVTLEVSGIELNSTMENNSCVKAYQLLKKDHALPPVQMHLHKVIPSGAGLGGGSADGSFALWLLNKKFSLDISEEQLLQYALQLGSDCPFFIKNKPCFATGRGENLEEISLDLSAYQLLLIYPNIHINTGWAFSQLVLKNRQDNIRDIIQSPVETWKETLTNDFEEPVFRQYPELNKIKEELYRQGALYASMSGSGSTLFGLFSKETTVNFYFPENYFVHKLL